MTSRRQKLSQKISVKNWDVEREARVLGDPKLVSKAIIDCLKENDLEGLQDVLVGFLRHLPNKTEFAKRAKLSRQALYDLQNRRKKFNPTADTLGAILKAAAA